MKKVFFLILILLVIGIALIFLQKENTFYFTKKKEKQKLEQINKSKEIYLTKIATIGEGITNIPKLGVSINFKLKYLNPNSNKPDFFIVTVFNNKDKIIKNLWIKLFVKNLDTKEEMSKEYQLVLDDNFKKGEKRKCILNWENFPENWDKKSFRILVTKIEYRGIKNEKKS